MHVALPKGPIHYFKINQQRRQQELRAYCPNMYTLLTGLFFLFRPLDRFNAHRGCYRGRSEEDYRARCRHKSSAT